jgi:hypothetical protein
MPHQWPIDKFYDDHTFSVDFGYSGKEEFLRIKELIHNAGLSAADRNVMLSLKFVKEMYPQLRKICKAEISSLDAIVKEEGIAGGFIPSDIFFASEVLLIILESSLIGMKVHEFIRNRKIKKIPDKIKNLSDKVTTKVINKDVTNSIIINYVNEINPSDRTRKKNSANKKRKRRVTKEKR